VFFMSPENDNSNMAVGGMGHCRRYPPSLDTNYFLKEVNGEIDEDSATESAAWWNQPIVDEDGWCGEYSHINGTK